VCGLYVRKEEKITAIKKELEMLKTRVAAREGERDIRRMLRPLREV